MTTGKQPNSMWMRRIVSAFLLVLTSGSAPALLAAEPTNGPLAALGLTNVPLGASTLEVVDGGVLFVHDSEGGGVSVLLGEADSGVFLYPLTGDAYEGYYMRGNAYGRFGGTNEQLVSMVQGHHSGNSRGTVTIDFTSQGATRLSAFVGSPSTGWKFLGRITNSIAYIEVQGNAQGCRANPWWRQPDGSFGAIVELAYATGMMLFTLAPDNGVVVEGASSIFIRPDDPTNTVHFISRVDVTAGGFGSFCLTDARVGVFHHGHKALGKAMLSPLDGRLTVGNLTATIQSNVVEGVEDGVFVELPSVSAFEMELAPLEIPATNGLILVSGYGTSGLQQYSALGTARIESANGSLRIGVEMGIAPQTTDVQVRSNGLLIGTLSMPSADWVTLAGNPRLTGCSIFGNTMEARPGFSVGVDRPTAFTAGGQTLEGNEVRLVTPEPVVFETLESFVMVTKELESFTVTGERSSFPPAPALDVSVSGKLATLTWPDPNKLYFVEASASFTNAFEIVPEGSDTMGNFGTYVVDLSTNSQRFFRLQRRMPGSD